MSINFERMQEETENQHNRQSENQQGTSISMLTTNNPILQGGRIILAVFILTIILSIFSIIFSAVSLSRTRLLSRKTTPTRGIVKSQVGQAIINSKKIWKIAVGHDYGAYEYFTKKGQLQGFSYDLVDAVCQEAGMQCRTIWDAYENCWYSVPGSHAMGGKGLMGGWYDACTAWSKTVDRTFVFDFTESFLQPKKAYLWIPKGGTNYAKKDLEDITFTVGFMDGWSTDEKCFYRYIDDNGIKYAIPKTAEDIKKRSPHYKTPSSLTEAVKQNKVKAIWAATSDMSKYKNEFEVLSWSEYSCVKSGGAMMTTKNNVDFIAKWNFGFRRLKETGRFAKLCEKAQQIHKEFGDIKCQY